MTETGRHPPPNPLPRGAGGGAGEEEEGAGEEEEGAGEEEEGAGEEEEGAGGGGSRRKGEGEAEVGAEMEGDLGEACCVVWCVRWAKSPEAHDAGRRNWRRRIGDGIQWESDIYGGR